MPIDARSKRGSICACELDPVSLFVRTYTLPGEVLSQVCSNFFASDSLLREGYCCRAASSLLADPPDPLRGRRIEGWRYAPRCKRHGPTSTLAHITSEHIEVGAEVVLSC